MQDTPKPSLTSPSTAAARGATQTALTAGALLFIPMLLGALFVLTFHHFRPPAKPPAAEQLAALTNRITDGTAKTVQQLAALRKDLRTAGFATDDVNLKLWAAQISEPACLFRAAPPEAGKKWGWSLSQEGLHAVAVSEQRDALDRRTVGLYDLIEERWLWTAALPWPDTHEQPHVFGKSLVLRYSKNGTRFALEVDGSGKIASIDRLGLGTVVPAPALPRSPLFPGTPVASRNGVLFAADNSDSSLRGYAQEPVPGLRYAGKGDINTVFSGNGLLKFNAYAGTVTVYDSQTQTVLQQIQAWPHSTNTVVTGTLTTRDGSTLTVFLKTDLGGIPAVTREWSVTVALYRGTVTKSFNADALFAKPKRAATLRTTSPDGQWQLAVDAANELIVSSAPAKREIVRVPLAKFGLRKLPEALSFLEDGRFVMLRQQDNVWLLDFALACHYGDLLAREELGKRTPPAPAAAETNLLAEAASTSTVAPFPPDPDTLSFGGATNAVAPAYLAMRSERLIAHQAWGYAAAVLGQTQRLQDCDPRAPRVNPLLLARSQIMCGQRKQSKLVCREALRSLFQDQTDYNRMIRYQLQGLLFAVP